MLAMVASMGGVRVFFSQSRRGSNRLNLVHLWCKPKWFILFSLPLTSILAVHSMTPAKFVFHPLRLSEWLTRLQISDILLMDDFKLRFAQCSTAGDVSSCKFSRVREGLIVALLSIGTLIGALFGAPYVFVPRTNIRPRHSPQTAPRISLVVGMQCRWSVPSSSLAYLFRSLLSPPGPRLPLVGLSVASVLAASVPQFLLFVPGLPYDPIWFLIWLTHSTKPKLLHLRFGEL